MDLAWQRQAGHFLLSDRVRAAAIVHLEPAWGCSVSATLLEPVVLAVPKSGGESGLAHDRTIVGL